MKNPDSILDPLNRMQVIGEAQSGVIILEQIRSNLPSSHRNLPLFNKIINIYNQLFVFAYDSWDQMNFQNNYSYKLTGINAKLRYDNEQLQKRISSLNIEISKLKESIQVIYNHETPSQSA